MEYFNAKDVPGFCETHNWIYRAFFNKCSVCGGPARLNADESIYCDHLYHVECDQSCHRLYVNTGDVMNMKASALDDRESEMAYRCEIVKNWNEFNADYR